MCAGVWVCGVRRTSVCVRAPVCVFPRGAAERARPPVVFRASRGCRAVAAPFPTRDPNFEHWKLFDAIPARTRRPRPPCRVATQQRPRATPHATPRVPDAHSFYFRIFTKRSSVAAVFSKRSPSLPG
ncbi:unnamed protein product, partial [Iphiclides podalirius]